ncbi:hypothetical protein ABW21_db0203546 [Orbilia brochopaga]|nr:hypothetical protein ABW21_db0203546 [Drechslerella brochopaga]
MISRIFKYAYSDIIVEFSQCQIDYISDSVEAGFNILSKTSTPSLPNAVPIPTATAPAALILRYPSASLTPPAPITTISRTSCCALASSIRRIVNTLPRESGWMLSPASPPIPVPAAELITGCIPSASALPSSEEPIVRKRELPSVFVAVMKDTVPGNSSMVASSSLNWFWYVYGGVFIPTGTIPLSPMMVCSSCSSARYSRSAAEEYAGGGLSKMFGQERLTSTYAGIGGLAVIDHLDTSATHDRTSLALPVMDIMNGFACCFSSDAPAAAMTADICSR